MMIFQYYFYVDGVRYEQEPNTSEQVDGKTVKYVCGFGRSETQMDIRQFLSMMLKDGESDTLGCYMLRGRTDDCYVSITAEEAEMGPPDRQPGQ